MLFYKNVLKDALYFLYHLIWLSSTHRAFSYALPNCSLGLPKYEHNVPKRYTCLDFVKMATCNANRTNRSVPTKAIIS